MLEFSADNMDQLEEECKLRAHEVSLATVKAIIAGCEADVDVVNIGFMKNLNMDITCERGGFIEALELNIPRCVELEEYELVIKANKWISKLKEDE